MNATPWNAWPAPPDALGESPFWHPHEQRLYWVDVPGRRLRRASADGADAQAWDMPSEPGCIAPAASGGLVVALRDGIYRAREWGGALARLAAAPHDTATTRFNDGKADPLGRFWAGTIYEPRDARKAALYCLDARPGHGASGGDATLRFQLGDAITANGLAFSPDAGTLYWADTPGHVIRAWDWDPQHNSLRNERVLRAFDAKPAGWAPGQPGYGGRPDGAAVDLEGNYWCAMFEGARLVQLSPAGELLRELPLPARCPTMPCLGGEDGRTLYVTTARAGRPADELQAFPASGQVLWTRVDVPGLPVNFFID
ncbi:MAG TPA: SMP-30/gluconolactonase/LRE family protein [Ramlibacter sp.]|nr:SMP-30/gluconolactonase/LRE family protein [Ramlibacter sp.]